MTHACSCIDLRSIPVIISVISVCNTRVKEKAGKEVQAKKSIPMIISMISVCNTRVKEKVGKEIQAKKSIEWLGKAIVYTSHRLSRCVRINNYFVNVI